MVAPAGLRRIASRQARGQWARVLKGARSLSGRRELRRHYRRPNAPVAQLDRALASGAKGRRFESCRAHHFSLAGLSSTEGVDTIRSLPPRGPVAQLAEQQTLNL